MSVSLVIFALTLGTGATSFAEPISPQAADLTFDSFFGGPGEGLEDASAIAINSDGEIYVADTGHARIIKYSATGDFLLSWGHKGEDDGEFDDPRVIEVGPDGNVYVANNNKIQIFDEDGEFIDSFGSAGSDPGQFGWNVPSIAFDNSGSLLVLDAANTRVQVFEADGDYLSEWTYVNGTGDGELDSFPGDMVVDSEGDIHIVDSANDRIMVLNSDGSYDSQYGAPGTGDGEFGFATKIDIDSNDHTYVLEQGGRIQKFDSLGDYDSQFGTPGDGDGQFDGLQDLAVATDGSIATIESGNNRVQKFTSSYDFDFKVGHYYGFEEGEIVDPKALDMDLLGNIYVVDQENNLVKRYTTDGEFIEEWGETGDGVGQMEGPKGIAVDASGYVYIADGFNNRVHKFDSDGDHIFTIAGDGPDGQGAGSAEGFLNNPEGVAVDADGNIYVGDRGNNRISKFDRFGDFVDTFGDGGYSSLKINQDGILYAADSGQNEVETFELDGTSLGQFGTTGNNEGELWGIESLAVDAMGNVFVSDGNNNRVQKFDSNGDYLGKYLFDQPRNDNSPFVPEGITVNNQGQVFVGDLHLQGVVVLNDPEFVVPDDLDSDNDGITDLVENAAPNDGDGNGDDIPDMYQTTVSSYEVEGTETYATLVNAGCSENGFVSGLSASTLSVEDAGYLYPFGLTSFTLLCNVGDSASIEKYVYTDGDAQDYEARKYRPETQTFESVESAVVVNETVGDEDALKITYSLTDGGALDDDGEVNGEITDPVGLALVEVSGQSANNNSANGASGSLPRTGTNAVPSIVQALLLVALGFVIAQRSKKQISLYK